MFFWVAQAERYSLITRVSTSSFGFRRLLCVKYHTVDKTATEVFPEPDLETEEGH